MVTEQHETFQARDCSFGTVRQGLPCAKLPEFYWRGASSAACPARLWHDRPTECICSRTALR